MPLHVEIVSPERVLWAGDADRVITRTEGGGDIAFLPGHTPFMGHLGPGVTEVLQPDGHVLRVAVHGGFVEVSDDRVSLLSDTAELSTGIDLARARAALERAESALKAGEDDEARAALRRAEVRLAAADDPA
ncbi:MAG: ATP synthase F1 subunit epsilon [Acidimicrobiales bacterium]|nr:ATP synthase F1 subunit epsilon [Acidimicrobiales bacterium]